MPSPPARPPPAAAARAGDVKDIEIRLEVEALRRKNAALIQWMNESAAERAAMLNEIDEGRRSLAAAEKRTCEVSGLLKRAQTSSTPDRPTTSGASPEKTTRSLRAETARLRKALARQSKELAILADEKEQLERRVRSMTEAHARALRAVRGLSSRGSPPAAPADPFSAGAQRAFSAHVKALERALAARRKAAPRPSDTAFCVARAAERVSEVFATRTSRKGPRAAPAPGAWRELAGAMAPLRAALDEFWESSATVAAPKARVTARSVGTPSSLSPPGSPRARSDSMVAAQPPHAAASEFAAAQRANADLARENEELHARVRELLLQTPGAPLSVVEDLQKTVFALRQGASAPPAAPAPEFPARLAAAVCALFQGAGALARLSLLLAEAPEMPEDERVQRARLLAAAAVTTLWELAAHEGDCALRELLDALLAALSAIASWVLARAHAPPAPPHDGAHMLRVSLAELSKGVDIGCSVSGGREDNEPDPELVLRLAPEGAK